MIKIRDWPALMQIQPNVSMGLNNNFKTQLEIMLGFFNSSSISIGFGSRFENLRSNLNII